MHSAYIDLDRKIRPVGKLTASSFRVARDSADSEHEPHAWLAIPSAPFLAPSSGGNRTRRRRKSSSAGILLVLPVGSTFITLDESRIDAVRWNAGRAQLPPIRRACVHDRTTVALGHIPATAFFHHLHQCRFQGQRNTRTIRPLRLFETCEPSIAFCKAVNTFSAGSPGRNPAVHRRDGGLRECILGVAALKQSWYAGGAHLRIQVWRLFQPCNRLRARLTRGERSHVRRLLLVVKLRLAFEVSSRDLVRLRRELKLLQLRERARELVDPHCRAEDAAIPRPGWSPGFEAMESFSLACGPNTVGFPAATAAATVGIHAKGGVDQVAMIRKQPVDSVIVSALLVRRDCEDVVAIRAETLALQAYEVRNQIGSAVLHPQCPTIEVAILSLSWNGSIDQSSSRASTTSRCAGNRPASVLRTAKTSHYLPFFGCETGP